MDKLNELKEFSNLSKIESMSPEEIHKWYVTIKNSLDHLSRHFTVTQINNLKSAILDYENRHGLR